MLSLLGLPGCSESLSHCCAGKLNTILFKIMVLNRERVLDLRGLLNGKPPMTNLSPLSSIRVKTKWDDQNKTH